MEQQTTRRRGPRPKLEAESAHQPGDVIIPAVGAVPQHEAVIERVSDMSTVDEKTEMLKFMEEPVRIMIHESSDPNPEPVVYCAVNGEGALLIKDSAGRAFRTPWLPRGQEITIRRKFVERLARARRTKIRTEEVRDANGDRATAVKRQTALQYPFQVVEDRNPKGPAWLKSVLADA